jgi:hypothetical protein
MSQLKSSRGNNYSLLSPRGFHFCSILKAPGVMRKILSLLVFLIFTIPFSYAQKKKDEKSPIVEFLNKRGYTFPDAKKKKALPDSLQKWPDTLFYNTVYKAKLLGSPTIPISFSRIEYINGKYEVSPTLSIGYGYAWFTGDFIFNENDKITVDPSFYFGLVGDVALQNDFSFNKIAGFFTGGFIGFGNFSLFFGYDYVSHSAALALGGRVDVYTISQKALHPIGKVYEERRHKRIAPRIENE